MLTFKVQCVILGLTLEVYFGENIIYYLQIYNKALKREVKMLKSKL